jgi:flagellar motor switch protein FliM/N
MSRVLTPDEIEALLAGGPIASAPEDPIRIGDPVEVELDGTTVAYGRLVSNHGRLGVRITAHAKGVFTKERDR